MYDNLVHSRTHFSLLLTAFVMSLYKPEEYQKEAVEWMKENKSGILSLSTGLGKTFVSLIYMYENKLRIASKKLKNPIMRNLVVCPSKIIIEQWIKEVEKMFGNKLTCQIYESGKIPPNVDLIFCTYALLVRRELDDPIFCKSFSNIFLDEAHAINNRKTGVFKRCMLLNSNKKWCITATPIRNSEKDIQSLAEFCNRPKECIFFKDYCDTNIVLPEKEVVKTYITLSKEEQTLYDNIREVITGLYVDYKYKKTSYSNIINQFALWRMVCNGPVLIDKKYKGVNTKIDTVSSELNKGGAKVIVFSMFNKSLKEISKRLKQKYVFLTGEVSAKERSENLIKFKTGDTDILLATYMCGGQSLNITEATRIFFLDPPWNVASFYQAYSRIYRIGQKNNVLIRLFIVKDSIEEYMMDVCSKKLKATQNVIDSKTKSFSGLEVIGELLK